MEIQAILKQPGHSALMRDAMTSWIQLKTAAAFVMQAKQKNIDLQLIGDCWSTTLSYDESAVCVGAEWFALRYPGRP
eukprot:gene18219-20747_t